MVFAGFYFRDFDARHFVGGERVGHDGEPAGRFTDDAADDRVAFGEGELLGAILVADNFRGFDDVFHEVFDTVTAARACQVGADTGALAAEAVTDDASGGAEHGFALREIAAGEVTGNQRGGLRYGVGSARSLGADGTGDDGVDWGPRVFVEGATFGGVGHVGEGLGADVADEAGEAVAAFPMRRFCEPTKVRFSQIWVPALLGIPQCVGEGHLTLDRTTFLSCLEGFCIS